MKERCDEGRCSQIAAVPGSSGKVDTVSEAEYVAKGGSVCPRIGCGSNDFWVAPDAAEVVDDEHVRVLVSCMKCGLTWYDWFKLEGFEVPEYA